MDRIVELSASGSLLFIKIEQETADGAAYEKFTVAKEFFAPLRLFENDPVDDASYRAIARAEEMTAAVSKALDALSYSPLSRKALIEKLRYKYKIDPDVAEEAADYTAEKHLLDEEKQASKIAEAAVKRKLWGKSRVVADLMSKGYPKDISHAAADSIDISQYSEALMSAAEKKLRSSKSADDAKRAVASLVRLGHSPSSASAAVIEILKDKN